jgi:hypothetical protein
MDDHFIREFQINHLAVWNERNRQRRDNLIETIYSDNIVMYDKDFILRGIKAISDFIDKVQEDPLFDFNTIKPIENVQDSARLFWSIKTGQGLLTGMDFFIFKEGKASSIHVFMDIAK